MNIDWQNAVTFGLVAVAAVYVIRRLWRGSRKANRRLRHVFRLPGARPGTADFDRSAAEAVITAR